MVVGVGHVAGRGREEADALLLTAPRTHVERDVVRVVVGSEPSGVQSRREVLRDRQREVDVPARVPQVVVVEVDRPVLLGAWMKFCSLASQLRPVTARVGTLTVRPCRRFADTSVIRRARGCRAL